jgi:hypothetical protein
MKKWILILFVLLTAGSFAFAKAAQQSSAPRYWGIESYSPGPGPVSSPAVGPVPSPALRKAVLASDSPTPLLVGAAVRDVSPTEENGMLPIMGVSRFTIVGVHDPIHTRVIALQNGETRVLIVCTETGKGPYGPQFAELLSKHTGIPVDGIFYTTTHTHSAPEITTSIDLDFKPGDEVSTLQLWGKYVLEQMYSAADEALARLQPAKVSLGYGESYINVNRNYAYILRDGSASINVGYNPRGISDKTLAVLRFDSLDNKPIAFLINYPCHMVTAFANALFEDGEALSADVNGFVSYYLEKQYPGAVAMWTSGAAGDQNPIGQNAIQFPNPDTGEFTSYMTGNYDVVRYWGSFHFDDIVKVLNVMDNGTPNLSLSYASGVSSVPTIAGAASDKFDIHLKVVRIGNIALAGSPAELYTSLGLYMKEHSTLENTIVFNHTWTQEGAYNGYVLDDETLAIGGYGYGRTFYKEGTINDGLTNLMNALIAKTR